CFDGGANILGRHQAHRVSLRSQQSAEMMRTAAGFHRDHACWQGPGESDDALAPHATPLDHRPNVILSNDAAAVLTQIDPKNRDLHWHGPSLGCRRQPTL